MLKKICPVCDLPLEVGNFCPRCKRMVRHPYTWEVDYYLNQSHPGNETDCGYHKPRMEAEREKDKGIQRTTPLPLNTVRPNDGTRPAMGRRPDKNNRFLGIGVIIVCFFLTVAANFAKLGFQYLKESNVTGEEVVISEEADYGWKELDEAEILSIGKPCGGYFHFPANGHETVEGMRSFLQTADFGYYVASEDLYPQNCELADEGESVTYFEQIYSFTLEDENTAGLDFSDDNYLYQFVDINYDTVTGQVHEYNSCFYNEEASITCLEEFLRLAEVSVQIPPEDSRVLEVLQQARAGLRQENGIYIVEGIFDVSIYRSDSQIEIVVSYNDPQSASDQET